MTHADAINFLCYDTIREALDFAKDRRKKWVIAIFKGRRKHRQLSR